MTNDDIFLQADVQLRYVPPIEYDEIMFVLWYVVKGGMYPLSSLGTGNGRVRVNFGTTLKDSFFHLTEFQPKRALSNSNPNG